MMKLSVSNFPMAGDDLTASGIVGLARVAEESGVDRLCIADYPFHEDCTVVMMACLAATSRLEVESLVTSPFRRAPDVTACAFATLAELSEGRAILGVGRGGGAAETWVAPWGFERPHALDAVAEFVAICRSMWAGAVPPFEGQVLHTSGRRFDFTPRFAVPILIAARGPKMLHLAGAVADIVHLALPYLDAPVIAENLAAVEEGIALSGRAVRPEIDLTVALSIDEDEGVAFENAKSVAAIGVQWASGAEKDLRAVPHGQDARSATRDVGVESVFVTDLASRWNAFSDDPLPADLAARMGPEIVDRFVVTGTPAQCGNKIARLLADFPQVTGLRLKLPKAPGPDSFSRYASMVRLAGSLHEHLQPLVSPSP
jgi:5,10-methylenetetrahydromethanopterin reductase